MLLLKDLQEIFLVIQGCQDLNILGNLRLKALELRQSKVGKILGRWTIVLHALQVADDSFGVVLLLVNNALKVVKLLVNLLGDLILKALLVEDALLHIRALVQVI